MSNKVTNIYIDTTGFCDDAMVRVNNALDTIVDHNGVENISPSAAKPCRSQNVAYFNPAGVWYYAGACSPTLDGKRGVSLWELESIASRCKQEKKEESLPTRNIYIDVRKLIPKSRTEAFKKMKSLAGGEPCDWAPFWHADDSSSDSVFSLFDYYIIEEDGRLFFVAEHCAKPYLIDKNEVSFDQLMSLTR